MTDQITHQYTTYTLPGDLHLMPDATYVALDDLRPLIHSLTGLPHFRYDPHVRHNTALETLRQMVKE